MKVEDDAWGGFRRGDIVAVEGRSGDWELMAQAATPGVWQIEPARPEGREREEVPAGVLRRLADAPHIRRGDLVMQNFPEQERASTVGAVYRMGRWVAQKTRTEADGTVSGLVDDVDTLVVVTAEQVASALRLNVRHGRHRGRIVQAVVSRHAGKYRVTCRCSPNGDICRAGRRTGWCSSLQAAQALWGWHTAGEEGQAPPDFAVGSPAATSVNLHQDGHHGLIQQSSYTNRGQWWANCCGSIVTRLDGSSWCTSYEAAHGLWRRHVESTTAIS